MKSLKLIADKAKEKGLANAEEVIVDIFKSVQEACPAIIADAETTAVEKSFAGVAIPVLAGLMPTVEKLADLNKDGQIGN